ncbi:hypothetical protein DMA11_09730 [Marinilabiliaceae bacterium JC017]|nr:hypothetical protein DMA11_09730 [Marinilabiliaceae bacterium JC017]
MIGFENIKERIIDLDEFALKWRFTESEYNILPDEHLKQLYPLDKLASKFLWDFTMDTNLHADTPFKKGFFNSVDKAKIAEGNGKEIKKWLYKRGLPFKKEVFLSWQPDLAMIVPWKLLIKYFDDFYYGSSDDLSVFDMSLNWALLFYHEDEIYFGSNEKFNPLTEFNDIDFIW